LEIAIGTNRLIFAYGENDPKSIDSITKHDFKGTKSELLLEIKYANLFDPNDKEIEYYDFIVKNVRNVQILLCIYKAFISDIYNKL
jgi:hypothetical protein